MKISITTVTVTVKHGKRATAVSRVKAVNPSEAGAGARLAAQ